MKKRIPRIIAVLLIFVMVTSLFASCKKSESKKQIRIGYFPNITHTQALLGIKDGDFKKAFGDDVDVSFISFNAGPAEIEAFFADEVDIGYIGPIPAINGYAKSGGDIKIIAGASNGGAMLVTKKDLVLSSASELDGKKIAIPQFGNTQHLELLKILSDNNLKTQDKGGSVQVIESANADIKTLMDKGDIDAALVPEPWGTRLVNEIGANILLDYDKIMLDGNYSTACVIASEKFIRENPDLVEQFLKVHIDLTERLINETESSMIKVNESIKELTGSEIKESDLRAAFSKLKFTYNPSSESINSFIDIYTAEGMLDASKVTDRKALYDLSILNKILAGKDLTEIVP